MARKRLPPKRSGNNVTNTRRTSNTKKRGALGNFELKNIGGVIRVVLLGCFVLGVAVFLFYPDICRLLERWHNASQYSGSLQNQDGEAKTSPVAHSQQRPANGYPNAAKSNPPNETSTATKDDNPQIPEDGTQEDRKARCADEILYQDKQVNQKQDCVRHSDTTNPQAVEKESHIVGNLMEEEQLEIDEEDAVEVIPLGEESRVGLVDLNEVGEQERAAAKTTLRTQTSEEEEVAKKQTITFTPVFPGDENIIRIGGRPKTNRASTQSKDDVKVSGGSKAKASNTSEQKSSTISSRQNSKQSSSKEPKPATKQKKKPSAKSRPKEEARESEELPEEVKKFRPTYLKTVTAKKIFADGRRIPPVELIPQKPTNSSVRVYLFNDFLSKEECDGLRRVHDKHVQEMATHPLLCFDSLSTLRKHLDEVNQTVRITPNDFIQGTKCVNASFSRQLGTWMSGNWSYSTAFYPGESRFSSIFASRVHQAMGLDPENGGKFQITSYPVGKAYKAHTDCIMGGTDLRDRVASVLVYLDDVPDGGETRFPELGIWVKPRKGRALVWNNMNADGHCEPHSLHVASKVNSGSKYILIRWYYYKSFYSLGKRPTEPPLPARPARTPRVSCDDYDNGSCRWYDEWNTDHLLDYEYNKYSLV